ncbi:SEC1 family transport protein-like protein SLY1 [Clathrospora elynae]|uniref:SEC1 family transport protein-like protein SLY1 n=1 Tax=Clathrospora elynae TaxID=706981 RepID=A0A6A5SIJ3_9PLEO|nr:SEC1 family transport protein-like protein SLY1 [Clathrospora elynae]
MAPSLRDAQVASLKTLLNLNTPLAQVDLDDANEPSTPKNPWKVLVFDSRGRDIISSVLRVHDLRAAGITIHLHINTTRSPIPGVPVVYLIEPTAENLAILTSDLQRGLYENAHVNFLGKIDRPLLEEFAAQTVASGTAEHIAQLFDQTLDYVCLDPDLFSLNMKGIFHTLQSALTADKDLENCMDRVVDGLYSVIATMESIPVIRCPKGGAAEHISAKLDRKLRDLVLSSKTNSSSDQKARPVLIIVDRALDLTPLLSHSWIYQSLVYDVLDVDLTKINLRIPVDKNDPEKGTKKLSYDLTASDYFWARNATLPFPNVAEDVTNEWNKYQEDADKVTAKTGTSIEDLSGESQQFAAHLRGAMERLPELRERKATIEMHMQILEILMEGIKNRHLDRCFHIEEELSAKSKVQMLDLIKNDLGNNSVDKLRLFLQWLLTTEEDISRADLDSFTQALEAVGAETTAVKYVKTVRQLTRMTMISSAPTQPAQSTSQLFGGFSGLSSRVFKDAKLSANLEGVLSGIKNFLPKNTDLTLTKITESLMDPSNAQNDAIRATENYLYYDPKSSTARGTIPAASQSRNQQNTVGRGIDATFGQRRQGFSEAIVFSVGGGSMDEYGNLQAWATRTSASGQNRRVVYGSTALYSANEFITKELTPLGKEST